MAADALGIDRLLRKGDISVARGGIELGMEELRGMTIGNLHGCHVTVAGSTLVVEEVATLNAGGEPLVSYHYLNPSNIIRGSSPDGRAAEFLVRQYESTLR